MKQTKKSGYIPNNIRVYCIGDIHGRVELLKNIHEQIILDSAQYLGEKFIIYLGDYIDRGLHSKEVIDLLLKKPLPGFKPVYLKGNHEQVLLDFLNIDPGIAEEWLNFGGLATILSYGISITGIPFGKKLIQLQQDFAKRIPPSHFSFYKQLHCSYEIGNYFFVHAGIKPNIALNRQSKRDMLWIRDEFLNFKDQHEKIIVHGHSISINEPQVLPNRIGIDTGAYLTGILTCLILEGEQKYFLATST